MIRPHRVGDLVCLQWSQPWNSLCDECDGGQRCTGHPKPVFAGAATFCTQSWRKDNLTKIVTVLSMYYIWGMNICKSQCWTTPSSLYRLYNTRGMSMSRNNPLTVQTIRKTEIYQLKPYRCCRALLQVPFLGRLQSADWWPEWKLNCRSRAIPIAGTVWLWL